MALFFVFERVFLSFWPINISLQSAWNDLIGLKWSCWVVLGLVKIWDLATSSKKSCGPSKWPLHPINHIYNKILLIALSCHHVIRFSEQSTQNILRFKMRGHMTPPHQPTRFSKKSQKLLSSTTMTADCLHFSTIRFSRMSASFWYVTWPYLKIPEKKIFKKKIFQKFFFKNFENFQNIWPWPKNHKFFWDRFW